MASANIIWHAMRRATGFRLWISDNGLSGSDGDRDILYARSVDEGNCMVRANPTP